MNIVELFEPQLDILTKFWSKEFLGYSQTECVTKYADLTFWQRTGMWSIVFLGLTGCVVLGMLVAGIIWAVGKAMWFAAPGVLLFIIIMSTVVFLLAWLVKVKQ